MKPTDHTPSSGQGDSTNRQPLQTPAEQDATADSVTTLADLKSEVMAFAHERDWLQFHTPKNLSMAIAAEAAELMEHFLWFDPAADTIGNPAGPGIQASGANEPAPELPHAPNVTEKSTGAAPDTGADDGATKGDSDEQLRYSDPARREAIADEVADIFNFLLQFASVTGIDLTSAARAKLVKNARKYPADTVRGRALKYTEIHESHNR